MPRVLLDARAKVNITFDILGKRPDGYHELLMIMQTIALCDRISVESSTGDGMIRVASDLPYLPADESNIAFKAAALFFKKTGIENDGVFVRLNKKIPVAAGLAGGSADAAAVLRGLNCLYRAGLSKEELQKLGSGVGSDVPFCIAGGTALATGRGEVVKPLPPMPQCPVVLVKPPFSLSTAKVYQNVVCENIRIHPDTEGAVRAIREKSLAGVARRMYNVLEDATGSRLIGEIKAELLDAGAEGAVMSGSGPSVFGLFSNVCRAETAYARLKKQYRDTFLTKISNDGDSL